MGSSTSLPSSSTATSVPTKLPEYFPRAPKGCEKPSEVFFACYSVAAAKTNADDTTCGLVGLEKCANELRAYEQCMDKLKVKERRYRVQEEYRVIKDKQ